MAIYSLFRWDQGKYEIYQDARPVPLMSDPENCPAPRPYSQVGYDISTLLCPLPPDARYVGTSELPQGKIVRPTNGYHAGVPQNRTPRTGSPNLGGLDGLGGFGDSRAPVQYIPPAHYHQRLGSTSHRGAHLTRVASYSNGAVPIVMPDGGIGYAPGADTGLGEAVTPFTFGKAVILNTVIGVMSTLLTTLVFRKAFNYEMATPAAGAAPKPSPALAESTGDRKRNRSRRR